MTMPPLTRRQWLSVAGSAALAALFASARAAPPRALKLLILGGTGFLGPHIVETALKRGHSMTLFNRGKSNTQLFPNLEKLQGDRKGSLAALKGRKWDAVIDTSAYVPREVNLSARLLAPNIGQYLFVSTVSVYADMSRPGMDESAPVATLDDSRVEKVTGETYGPLKALCEQTAERIMPGRTTVLRSGLIVGPGDNSDRFTYWPVRVARGGEVLAPGAPNDPLQFIDVRDLAEFVVACLERRSVGVYNVDARAGTLTMGKLLSTCKEVAANDARFTWIPAAFLDEQVISPWSDLPVWIPATGSEAGFGSMSTARALAAGLGQRPLADSVRDTLSWFRTLPAERQTKLRAGLSAEREAAVLQAWRGRFKPK